MEIFQNLNSAFLILLKVGIVLFLFFYLIFSLILLRQVKVMVSTLKVGYERGIFLLAYFHLIASILIFLISLTI